MMDSCCHSQLLAQAAGDLIEVDHDTAMKTRQVNASELVTWGNFQPLYQRVIAQDSSFLE